MSARFIEIRGGTGAGKSTLVRTLMALSEFSIVREDDPWVGRWDRMNTKVAVPGSYRMATGGLENRYTLEECVGMLSHAAGLADVVVCEGGMISKTTGVVYEWLRAQAGGYSIVYLKPTMERVCANMCKRRVIDQLTLPQIKAIERDHDTVDRAVVRAKIDGVPIMLMPSLNIKRLIEEVLR